MKTETNALRDFFAGLQTLNRQVELFMKLNNTPEFLSGFFKKYDRERDLIVLSDPHYFRTISKQFAQKGIIGRVPVLNVAGESVAQLEVKLFRIVELESRIHGNGSDK